jgi:hypothetical protein
MPQEVRPGKPETLTEPPNREIVRAYDDPGMLLLLSGDPFEPSRHQFRPASIDCLLLTAFQILNHEAREAPSFPGFFVFVIH